MSTFEDRKKQYEEVEKPQAKKKHIADGIRKKFAAQFDFGPLSDQEVIQRHYSRFGNEMEPEAYGKKLEEVYGKGYTDPEAPKETLGERVEGVKEGAVGFAQGLVPFLVPEAPKVVGAVARGAAVKGAAATAAKSIPFVSQAAFLGGHAINAAVDSETAKQLEQTAANIPVPDPAVITQDFYQKLYGGLSAQGYTDEQIMDEARQRANNIVQGYRQTTGSIEEQVAETQHAAAVGEPAHAAADAFFLGVGAPMIEGALNKGLAKLGLAQAARAAKPGISSTVGTIASHVKTGALVGAPGMGLQGAIEAGVSAAADNKTPQEIGQALVKGTVEGAKMGAIGGALIGGAAGTLEAGIGAAAKPFVARKRALEFRESAAQSELDSARLRGWQEYNKSQREMVAKNEESRKLDITKTGDSFRPHTSQVPLVGEPAEIATSIIQQNHGEASALTEVGLRAASKIEERIRLFQDAEKALNPTVELPGGDPSMGSTPVGGPLEAPGGLAPERLPAALQGPLGERAPGFVPPQGVAPMAGLEAAVPARAEIPLGREGVTPVAPEGARAGLGQPLGAVEAGGRMAPPEEINPRLETVSAEAAAPAISTEAPIPAPAPAEPLGEVKLPTAASEAIGQINIGKNAELAEGATGKEIELKRLGLPEGEIAKPGVAGQALDDIIRKADEHQLPVTTRITQVSGPRGGKIPLEKLVPWYEQRGFKLVESTKLPEGQMATATLRREPQPPPAKKISMLDAQRIMMEKAMAKPDSPVTKELAAPARPPGPGRYHEVNLWADSNIAAARERIREREVEFPEQERLKQREGGYIGEKGQKDPTSYDWADFADRVQIGVNMMLKHGLNKTEWIEKMVSELGGKFREIAEEVYQSSVAAFNARRPKGLDEVRRVVDDYVHQAGLGRGATRHDVYPEVNPKFAARVADAYHKLKNVKEGTKEWHEAAQSYEALNHEIELQYQSMLKAGYKVTFTRDDPYPTSADMRADVAQNKHIKAFKTGDDFHPFMTPEQNDRLRAVHDFYGHAAEGYEFGPRGEDAAFRKHASTLSNKSIPALATETRGQNSWVNFWPANMKLEPKNRPFAEQKFGLLPSWAYDDVILERAGRAPANKLTVGMVSMGIRGDTRMILKAGETLSRGVRPVKAPAAVRARFTADGTDTINEMMAISPQSATWYHDDIQKMHDLTSQEIPEVAEPGHQALFDLLLGFTSPNTNVPQNYARAVSLMKDYIRSGKVPFVQRFGQEVNMGSRHWVPRLNKLIERFGGDLTQMRDYLLTKNPKGVYNVEAEFGDKVGPFTLNIQGIHDQITVDVWMVRRLRRLSGKLHKTTEGKRAVNEDWTPTAQERRDIEESIHELSKRTGLDPSAIQAVLWDNEKMIWEKAGLMSPRIPFSVAAEGVLKAMQSRAAEISAKNRAPQQQSLKME